MPTNMKEGTISKNSNAMVHLVCLRMKSNISNFLYDSPCGRNNKKGEPWFAFS